MSRRSARAAAAVRIAARVAALGRAVEEPIEEVAEGDEDRNDEDRLSDLLRDGQVRRQPQHGAEHDRGEDRAAPERTLPRRRLRIPPWPTRLHRLPRGRLLGRVDLVPVVVDPHVVVAMLLRPSSPLSLRRHCGDYAERFQAISPPAITVCTTGPPRWYARWRQSSAATSTTSASWPAAIRPLRSARSSTCAAFTVHAESASSGASSSCVAASEQTSGRLSQKALPGLKSVASAIAAPASTSARPRGIRRPRKSALAGSRTPVTSLSASAAAPSSPVASRWSTERAPSSIASGIAPDSVNWSPCSRSSRPAALQAVR